MDQSNLPYSYKEQIEWLEAKKSDSDSIEERKMLNNIVNAVLEAKGLTLHANEMVHLKMNNQRYRKYVERVLIPEYDENSN